MASITSSELRAVERCISSHIAPAVQRWVDEYVQAALNAKCEVATVRFSMVMTQWNHSPDDASTSMAGSGSYAIRRTRFVKTEREVVCNMNTTGHEFQAEMAHVIAFIAGTGSSFGLALEVSGPPVRDRHFSALSLSVVEPMGRDPDLVKEAIKRWPSLR